ncbi:MAG: G1 family glutamic endopeptidase [Sciscionella sp.]
MSTSRTGRGVRISGIGVAVAACLAAALPATAATSYGPDAYADGAWGGYVANGQGFQSISGSWVQPAAQCTSYNDLYAPWVGIDGYGSSTVEQTGVETNCQSGSPVNRPWFEMYPAAPQYWSDPVAAGDHLTGSVVDAGGGNYTITLTDDTKGWAEHTTQHLGAQDVSAEAVIESPTRSYPRFSELDFSDVTVNGQPFATYGPQPITSGGYDPGPLSGGNFAITPGGSAVPRHRSSQQPQLVRF